MKRDLTLDAQLDWLLAEWHHHCKTYQVVRQKASCPQFRNARSSKGWDTTEEIHEDEVKKLQMDAVDSAVFQLEEMHRIAIYVVARNCYSGANVWLNPRLPKDKGEREALVRDARGALMVRLLAGGVM